MIAALMLAGGAAAATPTACPVERATYVLRGQPSFTAEFHAVATNGDWPLGVALAVHAAKTKRTYWFLPWNGGTDGRKHARWIRVAGDNLPDRISIPADVGLMATDANYNFASSAPKARDIAPAHFLLPWFARELWYATAVNERDDATEAFFDQASCNAHANAPVDLKLPPVG